jgi:metal-sulfur cluster biosynthetic enzyme
MIELTPRKTSIMRKTFIVFAVCIVAATVITALHSRKIDEEYLWTRADSNTEPRKVLEDNDVLNEKEVMDTIRRVIDPELGISIVDMGLIYKLLVEEKTVKVTMTLSNPTCPYGGTLIDDVKKQLFSNTKIQNVHLRLTFNPPWSADRLTPEAKRKLFNVRTGSD